MKHPRQSTEAEFCHLFLQNITDTSQFTETDIDLPRQNSKTLVNLPRQNSGLCYTLLSECNHSFDPIIVCDLLVMRKSAKEGPVS